METTKDEIAVNHYLNGLNCAQSVLLAFIENTEINPQSAQKLTSAFGGGMGEGRTCGVITGGLMVLGLKFGFTFPIDEDLKTQLSEKVEFFTNEFTNIHKSLVCKDLIKCDISTSDGREKALAEDVFKTLCPNFVRNAVAILEKVIKE